MRTALTCLLAVFLLGCSGDSGRQNSDAEDDARERADPVVQPVGKPVVKIDPGQMDEADRVLRLTNRATGVLTEGYYRLPDMLLASVQHYLDTWQLAKMPRIRGAKRAEEALSQARGIFTDSELDDLTKTQQEMDNALKNMIADYGRLEKYVINPEIVDDGREGRKISKNIQNAHGVFMRARNTWLEMLDKRAAAAQKIILQEHPLERQILAAEEMFVVFREVAAQLALDAPDRAALQALSASLAEISNRAAKPPFPASPALEREYRRFLKAVNRYVQTLDAALKEGFFVPQKRELNNDLIACRNAWNIFAREANNAHGKARAK